MVRHECKKRQLYVLGVNKEEETEVEEVEVVEEGEGLGKVNPHISVHAMSRLSSRGYRTMRVTVYVRKKLLHIFIDFGSTHNFLDIEMAKRLGCNWK